MFDQYYPFRQAGQFQSLGAALQKIEADLQVCDNSRAPENRFEVRLFRDAVPVDLSENRQLLTVGEHIFLLCPLPNGQTELRSTEALMGCATREACEDYIAEMEAMGVDESFSTIFIPAPSSRSVVK
jgi:hypothetical protein